MVCIKKRVHDPRGKGGRLWSFSITIDRKPKPSALTRHLAPYLGEPDYHLRARADKDARVDLHLVWPTADRPWTGVYTTGMSARPMTVPPEAREHCSPFAELLLRLPPDWVPTETCPYCDPPFVDHNPLADRRTRWPFEWLVRLARHPHENRSFLAPRHVWSTPDMTPLSKELPFAGFLIDDPADLDRPVPPLLRPDGTRVDFLAAVPLHPAELRAMVAGRRKEVLQALDAAGVGDLLDPARPSCV